MCKTNDGFEIAEMDLELRGPGEIFGTRQHGLPEMRVANLAKDGRLMELARSDAMRFLQSPNWQSTALGIRVKQNWDLLKA
jgi:ATP-dependent DNA helicase RecG